jgi:formamidopyrimidine-DNA glycosylase
VTNDETVLNKKLGQEPLESGFTAKKLGEILHKRSAPIKAMLLAQDLIAGIGNMYADEALFLARIHPTRPGNSLSGAEIKRLHAGILEALRNGIASKGASIMNYYRPSGETGTAHEAFQVAHRRGEDCPICGGPIKRIVVGGRGTYFCPICQH